MHPMQRSFYDVTVTERVAPGVPHLSLHSGGGGPHHFSKKDGTTRRIALTLDQAQQLRQDGYEVDLFVPAVPGADPNPALEHATGDPTIHDQDAEEGNA